MLLVALWDSIRDFVVGNDALMGGGDLTLGLMDALELFDTACDNFPPID